MRISVIGPVLNEAAFIGFSIMSVFDHVEEFIYAVSPKSDDGTIELLEHIASKYGKVKLLIDEKYNFDPRDMVAYNASFNNCIARMKGDATWFLHADMVVTKWADLTPGPLAWWTNVTSYARDMNTVITKGRCTQWKNIHAKQFGLEYRGGYGSANEDFYHSAITGKTYRHFGTDFSLYPYEVGPSGIDVFHYCELKSYRRRLEKMKLCLKTQHPNFDPLRIEEIAIQHPRVTLEQSCDQFGQFEFTKTDAPIPGVFAKYAEEFKPFIKGDLLWQTDTESGLTVSPQMEPTYSLK